ncbi:tyrosine--tRNA ligase, mitochondrial [Fopius arisanus]|uniref:Tyrosine--tRNA ligase n=1 Tax=Fopius arisanus TaxID=64838 RepID=A0A0C9QM19_9HYME|nr:PREDICTED: tyrosine--tRNA ligase, mitochondrial [Fopius arisanus]XP_011298429.1 PREDICTED: tyrosine--tRNA ligase, mitochondrial [Fopius arisanus]
MSWSRTLRLCATGKSVLRIDQRYYTNRNILSLHDRGMFQEMFPENAGPEMKALLVGSPQTAYAGFDPTAESLHVGNLLVLMNLLHWQRGGHQVIVLLGGATGQIGDPSHRTKERDEMNAAVIQQNIEGIRKNIETIFQYHKAHFWIDKDNEPLKTPIILNNLSWYRDLNVIQFIKGIGKYFRLGTMMGRSSVQSRLNSETGMSFTEFSYQVFQGYDWLYLFKHYQCKFQIGGNDQMGNIMSGHDLVRKATGQQVFGLTLPLITAEGGKKFGKSVGNAVWLSPEKSSPFNLYQFFIRTMDSDVENFLKLFTFLDLKTIGQIMNRQNKAPEKREAQRILAENVTLLVHGEEGLHAAKQASAVLYENSLDSLSKMSVNDLINVFEGAKVSELAPEPGITTYGLAMKINCFKTPHDAQRIISAGGFYINHSKIMNVNEVITPGIHILPNNTTLVRVGKKNYHVVRWIM